MKYNIYFLFILLFSINTFAESNFFSKGSPSETLPVELVYFTGMAFENTVQLEWGTATEINNYGFFVQRKLKSSGEWESLELIPGAGNSNIPNYYSYTDSVLSAGIYIYRLQQVDLNGDIQYSDTIEIEVKSTSNTSLRTLIPKEFNLFQNFPNPFNPSTTIRFDIPKMSNVVLKVYNIIGKEVAVLINKNMQPGSYNVKFESKSLPSGIYIYKLEAGSFRTAKKLTILK